MSKESEKETVFRTTKVRTKLKDDGSWMNRSSESEATTTEKPWMAELRARRENAASTETSPVSSPTSAPLSNKDAFTKLDKPASSSTTNGISGTSHFNKRPSEGYKKIAPHTVKPATDNVENKISSEEQEKRTTAASKVLPKSAARERSYVLSAAKKFETQIKAADTSVANDTSSFVAKRVKIADDVSAIPPPPLSAVLPSAVTSVTSVASVPEPQPQNIVKTAVGHVTVNETQKVEEAPPEPVKEDSPPSPPPVSTPPELNPVYLHIVSTRSQLDDSKAADTSPMSVNEKVQEYKPEPETSENTSSRVETLTAMYENLIPFETETTSLKDDEPVLAEEEEDPGDAASEEGDEQEPTAALNNNHEATTENLLDLISGEEKDPSSARVTTTVTEISREEPVEKKSVLPSPGRWSQDLLSELESPTETVNITTQTITTVTDSEEKDPVSSRVTTTVTEFSEEKDPSSARVTTTVTEISREEPAQPVLPSPGRWSQDLLTELESEEKDSVSSRVTTTVTEFSSADPFDPYPIGTTSPNSSSDLLQPISDLSINSEEKDPSSARVTTTVTEISREEPAQSVLPSSGRWSQDLLTELESEEKDSVSSRVTTTVTEFSSSTLFSEKQDPVIVVSSKASDSLADDITPIDTSATSLSTHRSWARTWETVTPLQTHIEESGEAPGEAREEDQQTLVRFERKSKEDDSPWDRWTSPSVYTITTTTEEEEESPVESQMHTVTTITTIRETYEEQEDFGMNRTVLQEVPRPPSPSPSPEPESKKPFVYLKEYVNSTELSSHNATDNINSWSSSYSSSLSSPCTYCGQPVDNDAKITIEHLNINSHPSCFKCHSCRKPMGDLLYNMFLHGGKVHCESCYSAALD
uniref:zinc finger protein 185 isoform X1 n=1 Tax=Doryrhamphus excisus TaxID=161450 RepID=UPI0025AE55EA|nr:zinc finger protein 185 isoform X1 [Doryrhamphus excisus]XP_057918944.1 zinc finger protein 185 isoform X1 [Doryrhamphus excisus]